MDTTFTPVTTLAVGDIIEYKSMRETFQGVVHSTNRVGRWLQVRVTHTTDPQLADNHIVTLTFATNKIVRQVLS